MGLPPSCPRPEPASPPGHSSGAKSATAPSDGEPPPFSPSGGGLMALLTAMDVRRGSGPSAVPPGEAPPEDEVTIEFPPGEAPLKDEVVAEFPLGFHTPKKSKINPTSVSNVMHFISLFL
jgi:hypothetical protein